MVKIKKRDKRSRLRGKRTCGHGSRKKARGKGSKGGKGKAGTGKRAGQKLTSLLRLGQKLGRKGFTSHKKLRKLKQVTLNIKHIADNLENYAENNAIKLNARLIGFDELSIKRIASKIKTIRCKSITKKLKQALEQAGVSVETNE